MKTWRSRAILAVAVLAVLPILIAAPGVSDLDVQVADVQAPIAFIGVNVVSMDDERILENRVVLVHGERIVQILDAERADIPGDAQRIEAAGQYLMPGLSEMHAHIPPSRSGQEWIEQVLFLYLANGITTIRGMLGEPFHLELREKVASGEILGPRIYTSGPSLNGNSIPSPDSARRAVIHQKQAGYDFLKLHPGLTRPIYDAIVRTADSLEIDFAGHVSTGVGLARTLEARQATIDHLDGYMPALVPPEAPVDPSESSFFGFNLIDHVDESRIAGLAEATRRAGVWNVPTQSLFIDMLSREDVVALEGRPQVRYMPRRMVENWVQRVEGVRGNPGYTPERAERFLEVRRRILSALHEAGANLLLGSDAPQIFNVPGFSIHQELAAMEAAGLSPYEALLTGTRNVSAFFEAEEDYGTVTTGRVADLILLDANPLEDVANVQRRAGVMVRGRWLSDEEIRGRLRVIELAHGGE